MSTADALWDALRDVACTTGRNANCIVLLRKHDVERAVAALRRERAAENATLREEYERLRSVLREIANEDYRGNRSVAAIKAHTALNT